MLGEPIGHGGAVRSTIRREDAECSVGEELDRPPAFVHCVVVSAAERHEIVEVGGSAVFPFGDVMSLAP